MAEFWKSTPSYWCKFCSTYVKDTPIERKGHESSFKHQNNIQRSLRELHKGKERDARDQQRAKDEVARLNGLVEGKSAASGKQSGIIGLVDKGKASGQTGSKLSSAAQRKLHAEQLLALGVELPEELKREVQGVGSWQVISERVIEEEQPERSLADIIKEEQDVKLDLKEFSSKGVHKRKAVAGDEDDEESTVRRQGWGSKFKRYPGQSEQASDNDLDALLNGVATKPVKAEPEESKENVKEETEDGSKPLLSIPDINTMSANVKHEQTDEEVPAVIFKKRKVKK